MRVYVKTFGCQMNAHDTTRLLEIMTAAGYEATADPRQAEVAIVNSCTVREKAWHKAVSEAGRLRTLKRLRPDLIVVLAGCVAEQSREELLRVVTRLDLVVGADHYPELPRLIERCRDGERGLVAVGFDDGTPEGFLPTRPRGDRDEISDFVTVMKGCEERCAYCIVPTVRGPERCRPLADILADVRILVGDGVREVTLLGQKVNAWTHGGAGFVDLLEALDQVPGLARVRFTSPHPAHVEERLPAAYARLGTLCEAIHLPVQSGSDAVLARMRRRYTRERYLEIVAALRRHRPEMAISTDLIVGYPGETDGEFGETLSLLEAVRFAGVFSFMYSPRPGTPAAALADDVPLDEKRRRLAAVHEIVAQSERASREAWIGRTVEVLVEGAGRMPGQLTGRTRTNHIVNFTGAGGAALAGRRGEILPVVVTLANPHSLEGVLAPPPAGAQLVAVRK